MRIPPPDLPLFTLLSMATAIKTEWLEELYPDEITAQTLVTYNSSVRCVQAEEQLLFRDIPLVKENPTITFRCQDEKLEEITTDFHNLVMIDDTPDVDETKVSYSEREEI